MVSNIDSAYHYAKLEVAFATEKKLSKWIGMGYNAMGIVSFYKSQYEQAIEEQMHALQHFKVVNNQKGISDCYNNIGLNYAYNGDHEKAIDYYYKAVEVKEKIGDLKGKTNILSNIGNLYYVQKDFAKATEHFEAALEAALAIDFKQGIATQTSMLGVIKLEEKKYDEAKANFLTAIQIAIEIQALNLEVYAMVGLASVYDFENKTDSALYYYHRAIPLQEQIGDHLGLMNIYHNLAVTYFHIGQLDKAETYELKSLNLAKAGNRWESIETSADYLYRIHKNRKQYKDALEMHELFMAYRDSTTQQANKEAVYKREIEFEYEQKSVADSLRTEEEKKLVAANLKLEKEENARQKQKSYFLYAGLFLLVVFGFFVANRLKISRKQNQIISDQKKQVDDAFNELEAKNHEILDSINYAKRIQTAILPPQRLVAHYLKNSFILYKPKDIVAGDFYWMEPTSDGLLFAAADCTGHGVPGAMVSVICNNGLNRAVREFSLRDPAAILGKTREIVIAEFEKSEEVVKDGMDIALCLLKDKTLKFSGAHNPLWIVRKDATEIEEYKANKQPIGQFDNPEPYTTHSISLNDGDTFYIFSDGYADQFGGDKGKKFKAANFKKLLLEAARVDVDQQRRLIDDAFELWRGTYEQLDDICVIGVKI